METNSHALNILLKQDCRPDRAAVFFRLKIIKNTSGKILGNLNTDQVVNSSDYSKLYNEIKTALKNGTTVTYAAYKDLNGDGSVNSTDYSLLYNMVKRNQ